MYLINYIGFEYIHVNMSDLNRVRRKLKSTDYRDISEIPTTAFLTLELAERTGKYNDEIEPISHVEQTITRALYNHVAKIYNTNITPNSKHFIPERKELTVEQYDEVINQIHHIHKLLGTILKNSDINKENIPLHKELISLYNLTGECSEYYRYENGFKKINP